MEGFVTALLMVSFVTGFAIGSDTNQETIDRFSKEAVCIERKVGIDLIKKCYILKEVVK